MAGHHNGHIDFGLKATPNTWLDALVPVSSLSHYLASKASYLPSCIVAPSATSCLLASRWIQCDHILLHSLHYSDRRPVVLVLVGLKTDLALLQGEQSLFGFGPRHRPGRTRLVDQTTHLPLCESKDSQDRYSGRATRAHISPIEPIKWKRLLTLVDHPVVVLFNGAMYGSVNLDRSGTTEPTEPTTYIVRKLSERYPFVGK
jgi:hypothetical protein